MKKALNFISNLLYLKLSNARICMLTEVVSSRKLEPTEDAGEAVPEL
jgi:hypothetical protein